MRSLGLKMSEVSLIFGGGPRAHAAGRTESRRGYGSVLSLLPTSARAPCLPRAPPSRPAASRAAAFAVATFRSPICQRRAVPRRPHDHLSIAAAGPSPPRFALSAVNGPCVVRHPAFAVVGGGANPPGAPRLRTQRLLTSLSRRSLSVSRCALACLPSHALGHTCSPVARLACVSQSPLARHRRHRRHRRRLRRCRCGHHHRCRHSRARRPSPPATACAAARAAAAAVHRHSAATIAAAAPALLRINVVAATPSAPEQPVSSVSQSERALASECTCLVCTFMNACQNLHEATSNQLFASFEQRSALSYLVSYSYTDSQHPQLRLYAASASASPVQYTPCGLTPTYRT
jgi:hypothetical protein